jgi:hypothetical protein
MAFFLMDILILRQPYSNLGMGSGYFIMHKPELKAGMPLDIVFEGELNEPNAHYMKAVIYDYDRKFLTISQTSPPLNTRFLNRRLLMTFLVRQDKRTLRFGFGAKLVNLIPDYEISSGNSVEALLVQVHGEPEPTDFRMYFRVKPPSNTDVCLFIEENKVNLMDISLGGAKFTYSRRYLLRPGDVVKFKLIIGVEVFNIESIIRNIAQADAGATNKNIQYVSVEFLHRDKLMEISLGKAIMEIERSLLSAGRI